ncbi:hypothetical protein PF011_g29526, partial [Phytophthora fragariae]
MVAKYCTYIEVQNNSLSPSFTFILLTARIANSDSKQQLVRLGRLGYVKFPGALTAQLLELLDREVVTPAQQDQDVDDDGGGVFGFEKIFFNADVIDKYRRQAPLPPHIAQRLTEELRDIFKTYFPGAIPRKWSILKSYP